jgi:hypothetical protein
MNMSPKSCCGTRSGYAAVCYECFPLREPTPLEVARKAARLGQKRAADAESDVWRSLIYEARHAV